MSKIAKRNIHFWEDVLSDMPKAYNDSLVKEEKWLVNNVKKDSIVLEIGCGDGRSLEQLFMITKNLVGIDHDKTAIKLAKEKLKDIDFKLMNAKELKFKDESFDYVICMTTFANFGKDKFRILSEMKRVLKDNGFILVSVYSENAFEERMKIYKKLNAPIKEIKGTTVIFADSLGDGDNISEQFSKEELEKIFNEAGLEVVEIKNVGILNVCKVQKA